MQAANYSYTRSGFESLRRRLAGAAAVFIAGIVIFAYAANPPKPAAKTTINVYPAAQDSPTPKPTVTVTVTPHTPPPTIYGRATGPEVPTVS